MRLVKVETDCTRLRHTHLMTRVLFQILRGLCIGQLSLTNNFPFAQHTRTHTLLLH